MITTAIIIYGTMFMVLSKLHQKMINARVHQMNVECQVAANPQTKSTNLDCESTCRVGCYQLHPSSQ